MLLYGGDGEVVDIYPAALGQHYVYLYNELETYNVTAVLTNPIGQSLTLNMANELIWPIMDMEVTVSILTAIKFHSYLL